MPSCPLGFDDYRAAAQSGAGDTGNKGAGLTPPRRIVWDSVAARRVAEVDVPVAAGKIDSGVRADGDVAVARAVRQRSHSQQRCCCCRAG